MAKPAIPASPSWPSAKGDTMPMRAMKEVLRVFAELHWLSLTVADLVEAMASTGSEEF